METIEITIDLSINYDVLKKQKDILIKMIEVWRAGPDYQRIEAEEIEGIVQIIDDIQDYAVDSLGMDENKIFNFKF